MDALSPAARSIQFLAREAGNRLEALNDNTGRVIERKGAQMDNLPFQGQSIFQSNAAFLQGRGTQVDIQV